MPDVLVAVPTFRRPNSLSRLLDALASLSTTARVEILVADNDGAGGAGLEVCEQRRAQGYRWPLHAIAVGARGIAQARNALVEYALTKSESAFVAMLDDDEWPDARWLDAFLHVQRQTGAEALHGAVLRVFDTKPAAWASSCQGMAPLRARTGPVDMIHGTANVLLSRSCLLRLERPWFDPAFALTGGEDKEFFTRLRRLGVRFAWADEAVVHAHVPASRSTLGWALQRAYRVGNSDMRVFLKHEVKTSAFLGEYAKIVGALILFPLHFTLHAASPAKRTSDLCRLWRAAGKAAALWGRHYNEYAIVHGA